MICPARDAECEWPDYCRTRCAIEEKETVRRAGQRAETDAKTREAEVVRAWRARHPDSFCSDRVALLLAGLDAEFSRR
jgi:hypothetical protein